MRRPGLSSRRLGVRDPALATAGAPSITPASFGDPNPGTNEQILWLRGDLGITLAGSKVTTWADQFAGARNYTQGTDAVRPTIGTATFAGKDCVVFATLNQLVGASLAAVAAQGTMFIIFRNNASPPSGLSVGAACKFGSSASADHMPFTDNNYYVGPMSTVRKTTGATPPSSTAVPHCLMFLSASAAFSTFFNNSVIFTTGTNTVGWSATPRVGGAAGTDFIGDIGEIIIYGITLTAPQYTSLYSNYLQPRYSL